MCSPFNTLESLIPILSQNNRIFTPTSSISSSTYCPPLAQPLKSNSTIIAPKSSSTSTFFVPTMHSSSEKSLPAENMSTYSLASSTTSTSTLKPRQYSQDEYERQKRLYELSPAQELVSSRVNAYKDMEKGVRWIGGKISKLGSKEK